MGLRELTDRIEGFLEDNNVDDETVRAYVSGVATKRQQDLTTHRRRPHYFTDVTADHLLDDAELHLLQNSIGAKLLVAREARGGPLARTYANMGQYLFVRAAKHYPGWEHVLSNVAEHYADICLGLQYAFNVSTPVHILTGENSLLERTPLGTLTERITRDYFNENDFES